MFQDSDMLLNIFKVILALPVVILLAHISLRLTNRYLYKQSKGKMIKIIEKTPIDNKSSLCVVKIGKEYKVIGTSENNFQVIKDLSQEELEELLINQKQDSSFTDNLAINFKKWIKEKSNHE